MFEEVEITINGTYSGTYYVSADLVRYISNDFVNTGNTTIYLYKSLSDHSEYIRLNSYAVPQYYRSYSSQIEITDVTEISYNLAGQFYRFMPITNYLLLFVMTVFCILKVFSHD